MDQIHMTVQHYLKFSSCYFFLLMINTSYSGLKAMPLRLFKLLAVPNFLSVTFFSLNIL